MQGCLLASDLGTSGCRTAVFDGGLRMLASASVETATSHPRPGWAEQEAEGWWRAFARSAREAIAAAGVAPGDIAAVGIDAMSSVALPVAADGRPLAPGLLWYDRRAAAEAAWMSEHAGDLLARIAGNRSDASNFGPKLLWLRGHAREAWAGARFFLHANGFLVLRLTGEATMDISECGLSQLCDLGAGCWSEELVAACDLDPARLPPILGCAEIAGEVRAAAAEETGLAAGTPVIAGAMDNVAAALGAGLAAAGRVGVSAGTATNTNVCSAEPLPAAGMHCYHHGVAGLWIAAGGVDYGGAGLRWFRDLIGEDGFGSLDAEVSAARYDAEPYLFLPYLVGQRAPLWNADARGALIGFGPAATRASVARAVMEGNALGTRRVLDGVERAGLAVRAFRLTGGCCRSSVWPAIFADATGRSVDIAGEHDVTTLGTALMAAAAVGIVSDLAAAAEGAAVVEARLEPRPERRAYYDRLYEAFCRAYDGLGETYGLLAALRGSEA